MTDSHDLPRLRDAPPDAARDPIGARAADVLRLEAAAAPVSGREIEEGWARLEDALFPAPAGRGRRTALGLAVAAAAGVLITWGALRVVRPRLAPGPAAPAQLTLAAGTVTVRDRGAASREVEAGQPIAEGAELTTASTARAGLRIPTVASLVLGGATRAAVRQREAAVNLAAGRLVVGVVHQARGQRVVVTAGAVRVTAVGTRFAVERTGDEVAVALVEGVVEVARPGGTRVLTAPAVNPPSAAPVTSHESALLDLVGHAKPASPPARVRVMPGMAAGNTVLLDGIAVGPAPVTAEIPAGRHTLQLEHASEARSYELAPGTVRVVGDLAPPAPSSTAAGTAPTEEEPDPDEAAARERPARPGTAGRRGAEPRSTCQAQRPVARATACYERQARQGGLTGENALLRVGLLRLQSRDARGALRALEEHRSRFPRGQLRREVDLTVIQALAVAGRTDRALAEARRYLARHSLSERAGEVEALTGDLLRDGRGDCAGAAAAYRRALARGAGPATERALYFRAACLEATGERAGATAAFRRYLARHPHGQFAAEARRRLAATGRAP